MEQSETVTDLAPKKLARQLDFTAACRAVNGVVLQPQPAPPPPPPQPPQPSSQPHLLQQRHLQLQAAQKQPPMPTLAVRPTVPQRIPHPVQKLSMPTMQHGKQESPGARLRANIEGKDGTPKKSKQCNCKNSRCLKLYCECFAAGTYCNGCNCINCHNNVDHETARKEAVEATLERNPNAFRPKIASSPHGSQDAKEAAREVQILAKHNKGCHCKKSGCLKKYCECFQANVLCSENCKCLDCKNFDGSEERRALFHGTHHGMAYIQQAAFTNAAISGAIGSSGFGNPPATKKRKNEELIGIVTKDQLIHPAMPVSQDDRSHLRNAAPAPFPLSIPASHTANAGALRSSKLRSPLADLLRPQDVKEMCSVFVLVSAQSTDAFAGKRGKLNEGVETSSSSIHEHEDNPKGHDGETTVPRECPDAEKAERDRSIDSGRDGGNMENGTPLSPDIDLMCHEEEMMFMDEGTPTATKRLSQNRAEKAYSGHEYSETYAEQEKQVLRVFRDLLNQIVLKGSMIQTGCSPVARSKIGNQQEAAERNSIKARMETQNHGDFVNGFAKSPTAQTSDSHLPLKATSPIQQETAERSTAKPKTETGNDNDCVNSNQKSPIAAAASGSDVPIRVPLPVRRECPR
ncbi:hypothetical protein Tsubulata_017438 [Turnera subulata]|uniref:CRC domain-containing protein n=1 Tax=Turnera subulata TaxID=218843 RepID=A0A9Q0JIK6_9ROSI|nr:hypothetical protein Tsubulata_017438 [Turnera subulata]